jgi:cell division protein FtsI (penicillin-binding protein 3)
VQADSGVTSGGFTAAPAAGRVIDRIAPFLGVRRVILASDVGRKSNGSASGGPDAGADQLGANER